MKIGKVLRIVVISSILSLLVAAIIAPSAMAAARITLDPTEGRFGEYFYVDGRGFPASVYTPPESYSYVDIYFSGESGTSGDKIDTDIMNYKLLKESEEVDDVGEFQVKVKVPDKLADGDTDEVVRSGTYYVYITIAGSKTIKAVADFKVIASEITPDPTTGTVGTDVNITGTDFNARENITIEYDAVEIDIASADTKTDSSGSFTSAIIVPESVAGKHTVTVTDETGYNAEAEFTVEPKIASTPATGAASDTVTVAGTGFGQKVDVSIKFDGVEITTDKTDDYGSFQGTFALPVKSPGTYKIEARDSGKNKGTVDFTVAAGIKLGQNTGNVGTQVTVSGTGFTPNATVTVTYEPESTPVATPTTEANGRFSATFAVPESKHGQHTITATDGTNTISTTFTMESTPPPIPKPLLPINNDKSKSQASFDWEDVTDPSLPVTYDLQIAADESFSSSSLLLEKTGLTTSDYTLTKEERLKSTKKESPYYWRVQALDGASNASGWTNPGSFYVGFSLELTGWVLYVLIGIAGVILFLIGILLGRRSAYY